MDRIHVLRSIIKAWCRRRSPRLEGFGLYGGLCPGSSINEWLLWQYLVVLTSLSLNLLICIKGIVFQPSCQVNPKKEFDEVVWFLFNMCVSNTYGKQAWGGSWDSKVQEDSGLEPLDCIILLPSKTSMASNTNHIYEPKTILLFICNLLCYSWTSNKIFYSLLVRLIVSWIRQKGRIPNYPRVPGDWFLRKFITCAIVMLQI